jgi:hypothetical protein
MCTLFVTFLDEVGYCEDCNDLQFPYNAENSLGN